MARRRTRIDASGRHAAELPGAAGRPPTEGPDGSGEAAEATAAEVPADPEPGEDDSSDWTGQTLVGGSRNPPPGPLGIPETGPTKPWLAKPAAAEPAAPAAPPVAAPPPTEPAVSATEVARPAGRDRRRAPSEPGSVLQQLAADIAPTPPVRQAPPSRRTRATGVGQAPLGRRVVAPEAPAEPDVPDVPPVRERPARVVMAKSAPPAVPAAVQPADAAVVLAAESRLEDLSRRLNDVEQRADRERQVALQRLAETEQLLIDARRQVTQAERLGDAADARVAAAEQRAAEYEHAHGTLRHTHNELSRRHDEAIRELDIAVGLLAEEVGRREDFEQRALSASSLLETERRAKHDLVQQAGIEHHALTARLKAVEKRLADAVQQSSIERAEHRQLLERAQGALTAESQARTDTEDQLAEMSRAAEVLQAQQAAEIGRLNIALKAAIDRRVEFEARIADMEAGIRAQRDAEARSWVGAEQRLAETIAALESERARGEQWRRQTATDVQQQLRDALGELSGRSGKHSDAASAAGPPAAHRPRPRPPSTD